MHSARQKMLPTDPLHRLLLAGVCLCVCGNAVQDLRKEAAGSVRWRSLRMVMPNGQSLDAESKPKALKFWRMLDRENIHKAVLERTQRDTTAIRLHEDTRWSSSTSVPNPSSPLLTPVSVLTRTTTPSSMWEREGPILPTPPEPFLPDMSEDTMPKEDGMEGLWTEAPRPSGANTAAPPSQDDTTEGTMSSESLPLIFEPMEESVAQLPAVVMATAVTPLPEEDSERAVTTETDKPLRTMPLMTTEVQLLNVSSQSGTVPTSELTDTAQDSTPVTAVTNPPVPFPQSGLEETDSEDDPDEENSEESLEDEESQEDPTETSRTQPTYSLIPPPPVWVQRNQGLMRSWVALIQEKAGYVSGMLAPVAIGMAGALLLVGALYSMRRIQRSRRNSFKRQRRKVRPAEQPGETCIGRQDQAMLLADSSEDEF
ncbi:armadillo-like helical domain-containing protein 4 [Syngnathus typhle]|uniref:armadillo-like helical domain-containing protein 4 n=1 Tax=Syngnathus typhle TaxID=161592 RepID=UPI002A6ABDFA|nr:armadillo-like helical domain-containing protein 4 [Syngnathus typhle]